MAKPTYQDATLMLQLERVYAAGGIFQAGSWLWSEESVPDYAQFLETYPPGSEEQRNTYKLLRWFEIVGTLHKQGLVNEELAYDCLGPDLVWDRMKGVALGMREQVGDERILENFEALGKARREDRDLPSAPFGVDTAKAVLP